MDFTTSAELIQLFDLLGVFGLMAFEIRLSDRQFLFVLFHDINDTELSMLHHNILSYKLHGFSKFFERNIAEFHIRFFVAQQFLHGR